MFGMSAERNEVERYIFRCGFATANNNSKFHFPHSTFSKAALVNLV